MEIEPAQQISNGNSGSGTSISNQNFLHKYCRTCGTQLAVEGQGDKGLLIFGPEGRSLQLSEKIRKTCSVLVLEEDTLPKRICFNCCTQLEEYSEFKENVHDTQDKLRTIIRSLESAAGADSSASPGTSTSPNSNNIRSLFLNSGSRLERALRSNLVPAISVHPNQLECKDCKRKFKDQSALEVHAESEHPQNPVEVIPENPPSVDEVDIDNDPPSSVESPNDPNSVPNSNVLTGEGELNPSAVSPGQNVPSQNNDVKRDGDGGGDGSSATTYACESCDRVFMSASGYYTHVVSVHKGRRFSCPHCSVKYAQKASLTVHLRTHHPNSPQIVHPKVVLQCPNCPSKFYDRKSLTIHATTHLKDRNYQCHICSKYYKTSRCLSKHVVCHLSSDKFKCSICNKGFNRKTRLEEHYNTHNGANGLGCPFCFKLFNSYANYSKHVKRKHSEMISDGDRLPQPKRVNQNNSTASTEPVSSALASSGGNGSVTNTNTVTTTSSDLVVGAGTSGLTLSTYTVSNASARQNYASSSLVSSQSHSQEPTQNSVTTLTIGNGAWVDNPNNATPSKISNYNQNQQQQLNSSGMDLVDCAIHTALLSQDDMHQKSHNNNYHSHSSTEAPNSNTSNSNNLHQLHQHHQQSTNSQSQLTYKYPMDPNPTFQEMPMELTKVFPESASSRPLELCVRNEDNGFSQLVDLTSSKESNLMNCHHQNHSHQQYGTTTNNNNTTNTHQYNQHHQQQQPIDLISRSDVICNLNNSVDLSLRSTFSDQSTSSFIRELLDLSSRSEYLHEPTHTSPTKSTNQIHQHHQLTELNLSCPSTNRNTTQIHNHVQNLYNTPNSNGYYNRLPPAPSSIHPPPHNIPHYTSPTNNNNNNGNLNHQSSSSANNLLNSVYSDALFS